MVVWIEIIVLNILFLVILVTTCVVVWIEMVKL